MNEERRKKEAGEGEGKAGLAQREEKKAGKRKREEEVPRPVQRRRRAGLQAGSAAWAGSILRLSFSSFSLIQCLL